jgi:hypothetical protein
MDSEFVAKLRDIIKSAKEEISSPPTTKPRLKGTSIERAKSMNLYRETMVFCALDYDDKKRTVIGETVSDSASQLSDCFKARILGVDEKLATALLLADWAECEVMAVVDDRDEPKMTGYTHPISLILSKPKSITHKSKEVQDKITALLAERKESLASSPSVH